MNIDIEDIERIHAGTGEPPTSMWVAAGDKDVGIVFLVGMAQVVEEVESALRKVGPTLDLPSYTGLAANANGECLKLKSLIFGAWDSQDEAQAIVREISQDIAHGPAEWVKTMCEIAHRYRGQNIIATADALIPSEMIEDFFEMYVNECRRAVSN